jgi:3-methyladenine DNA glycosylase/8-oxoguanine DNA glycosylase
VVAPTVTSITPPPLASLPVEREQLEYSSRWIVFAEDGERLLRAWGTPERPWVLAVEPDGRRWRVEAWGADAGTARAAARALFSLDHPIEAFYRLVRQEPVLRGTDRRFRGLRIPRDAHVYEAILHSVLGQQVSVRAATTMKERLLEKTGAFLEADGVEVPRVPTPRELRSLGVAGLRSTGVSRVKARSLLELARAVEESRIPSEPLASAPIADAVEALDRLPGVGRWTAENALLRGVGRTDVFIAGDLGIRVALEEYGVLRRTASEERARAWADRNYPGWGSYATLYLWRKLVADRSRAETG